MNTRHHYYYSSLLFLVQSPNLSHPFHLHGAPYNVIGIGRSPDKNIKKINLKHALDLDRQGLLKRQYDLPPYKDTIAVPNNGYVVLRLKADNPGTYVPIFLYIILEKWTPLPVKYKKVDYFLLKIFVDFSQCILNSMTIMSTYFQFLEKSHLCESFT